MKHLAVFDISDNKSVMDANVFLTEETIVGEPQVEDGKLLVWYLPQIPDEELEAIELTKRIRETRENLIQARTHEGFLKTIKTKDHLKHQEAMDNNQREVRNFEALLDLYENWGKQDTSALAQAEKVLDAGKGE